MALSLYFLLRVKPIPSKMYLLLPKMYSLLSLMKDFSSQEIKIKNKNAREREREREREAFESCTYHILCHNFYYQIKITNTTHHTKSNIKSLLYRTYI